MKGDTRRKRALSRYNRLKSKHNRGHGKPVFKWGEPKRLPPWLKRDLKG